MLCLPSDLLMMPALQNLACSLSLFTCFSSSSRHTPAFLPADVIV